MYGSNNENPYINELCAHNNIHIHTESRLYVWVYFVTHSLIYQWLENICWNVRSTHSRKCESQFRTEVIGLTVLFCVLHTSFIFRLRIGISYSNNNNNKHHYCQLCFDD